MAVATPQLSRTVQNAIRYSNAVSEQIVQQPQFGLLRARIVQLFLEENRTSEQIAREVEPDMGLNPGITIATASSIIRQVLRTLVDDESRGEVHSVFHANALERRREDIDGARDKWMLEQGYKVWSEAEDVYFLELIARPDMKRGTSDICNHKKIAEAMCARFGAGTFDADACRRHLESIRRIGHVPQSKVPRKRKGADTEA